MAEPRMLSLGYDNLSLPVRAALLRHAGYAVVETCSWGEALKQLKAEPFDLLLMCHTVPVDQRDALIEAAHLIQPDLRFLCLTAGPVYSTPDHCPPAGNSAPDFLAEVSNALHSIPKKRHN